MVLILAGNPVKKSDPYYRDVIYNPSKYGSDNFAMLARFYLGLSIMFF